MRVHHRILLPLLLPVLGAPAPPGTVVLKRGPDGTIDSNYAMAAMRLSQGRYRMAIDMANKCIEAKPGNNKCRAIIGRALGSIGKCEQAIETLTPLRQKRVWDEETAVAEGQCHLKLGDVASALAAIEGATFLGGQKPNPHFQVALAQMRLGDWGAAWETIETLHTLKNPANMPFLARATYELEVGSDEYEATMAELARESAENGGATVQIHIIEGRRWMDYDEPFLAADEIFQGIRVSISNVRAAAYRAEAVRRQGEALEALFVVDRQWITAAATPVLQAMRARILIDLDRMDEARETIDALPDPYEREALATRWYLARVSGQAREAERLAREWRALTPNPLRSLSQLIPLTESP